MAGIFYSDQELTMWQSQSVNGPFKVTGDAFTNSPDDWPTMLADAATFGTENYPIWQGPVEVPVTKNNWATHWEDPSYDKYKPTRMMVAAFVDLVRGTNEYTAKIKQIVLDHAVVPKLDFSDSVMYPNGDASDQIWAFAHWHRKLLLAYDYVGRNNFTTNEQTLLEDWFEASALWHIREVEIALNTQFSNVRDGNLDNYTGTGGSFDVQPTTHTYDGGPSYGFVNMFYNNRRSEQVSFGAHNGVLTNNSYLIDQTVLYIKEYLAFYWFGNGAFAEQGRNTIRLPPNGMFYGATCFAPVAQSAKVLYENGYENLFEYTTQAGGGGTSSPGIDKGLEWAMLEYVKYIDGTYNRTYNGGSLNPYDYNSVEWMISAVNLNTYYNNAHIKEVIESSYTSWIKGIGSYPGYYGVAGNTPAYIFMYKNLSASSLPPVTPQPYKRLNIHGAFPLNSKYITP